MPKHWSGFICRRGKHCSEYNKGIKRGKGNAIMHFPKKGPKVSKN